MYLWLDLQGGPAPGAVCPHQCEDRARHHEPADGHRADPVLHPGLDPGLQPSWCSIQIFESKEIKDKKCDSCIKSQLRF